jgi:hypothetical protein
MSTGFNTTIKLEPSVFPSYPERAIPLRLLAFPKELRLNILEYVAADNAMSALDYFEFCRLFLSSSSPKQACGLRDLPACTCQTPIKRIDKGGFVGQNQVLSHPVLRVNRQLRHEYIDILHREANLLICHCTLFSRIGALEQNLTPAFTKEHVSRLKELSISVKHTNALFNISFGYSGPQTWPSRDDEHRMALTSLGVHLTSFLGINGINPFQNVEQLTIYWVMHTKKTFRSLDDSDMETVLELVLWKTGSRLTKLKDVELQVEHGGLWKRRRWMKTRGVWKHKGTVVRDC